MCFVLAIKTESLSLVKWYVLLSLGRFKQTLSFPCACFYRDKVNLSTNGESYPGAELQELGGCSEEKT